ncbi:MAG: bacterial transcriptional activator domain-containing protein [Cyanobacteria bacterium P01_F01_bin.153]
MADSSHADDIVTRYIQRISELNHFKKKLPNQKELEAIALEMGMDEADIKLAKAEARACLQRARTYSRAGRWEDAIAEFERASLVPITDADTLLEWAQAHQGRYQETRESLHREKGQRLARQCLGIAPDSQKAAQLLNQLDEIARSSPRNSPRSAPPPVRRKTSGVLANTGRAVAVVLILAGVGAFGYLRAARVSQRSGAPVPVDAPVNAPNTQSKGVTSKSVSGTGTDTIPAELIVGENGAGLELETRNSGLTRYSNSTFYKAAFSLVNNTQQEISEADAQLEYLDSSGNVIHTKSIKIVSSLNATLRPGDRQPVTVISSNQQVSNLDKLSNVRLKTTYLKTAPAPASYPASPAGNFGWAAVQPPGADLKIGIRTEAVSSYQNGASNYLNLVLEVTNTGSVNLSKLKLEVEVFDEQDQSLKTRPLSVSSTLMPPLVQGETRLMKTTIGVPRSPQKYTLMVVEAQGS